MGKWDQETKWVVNKHRHRMYGITNQRMTGRFPTEGGAAIVHILNYQSQLAVCDGRVPIDKMRGWLINWDRVVVCKRCADYVDRQGVWKVT